MAGSMLAGPVKPAEAINKEWSAALGFLGGVLVANNANCNRSYYSREVVYQQPVVYRQPVVYQQPVVYERAPCPAPVIIREQPTGHYEYREHRQWVAGRWVYEEIGCNTYRKSWQPGYYKTVTVKVWVPNDCDVAEVRYSE
jgi:hypothetical protein